MNYIELINTFSLVALTIAYFIQNNQLKFMKSMIDSYQPEKLKQAQEFIEQGRKHEFNLILSQKTKKIVSEVSHDFQEINKEFLGCYNECLNNVLPFLMEKSTEEREAFLTKWPKNAQIIREILKAYDAGLSLEKGK